MYFPSAPCQSIPALSFLKFLQVIPTSRRKGPRAEHKATADSHKFQVPKALGGVSAVVLFLAS